MSFRPVPGSGLRIPAWPLEIAADVAPTHPSPRLREGK
ncbi:hypothetical protein SFOMI_1909 [Sphingobium fuliginis]|uniref:Uncharacterized protein n=1 Tax=Sphingobium fuliginis (strain ATCC 27551) TaxID=336203 RepID=A0A292ZEU0_SPHSA|nr:hypothetical protein SFOMI_1909 [Sphingobium fuliginis]